VSQDDLVADALDSVVEFDPDTPTPQAEALGEYVLNLPRGVHFDLTQVSTLELLDELRRRVLGGSGHD
jgi:hypothetical protein